MALKKLYDKKNGLKKQLRKKLKMLTEVILCDHIYVGPCHTGQHKMNPFQQGRLIDRIISFLAILFLKINFLCMIF